MDVEATADIALKRAVGRVTGDSAIENPAVLSAAVPQPVLHFEGAAGIKVADIDLQAAVKVVGVDVFGPAIARFLLQSAPDEIQPNLVEVEAKLVGARHPDHDGRGLGDHAETLLALPQRLFGSFAFGYVASHRQLNHGAIRPAQGRRMRFHMPAHAFEPDDVELQGA